MKRASATDETDKYDTIAEATRLEDGTIHFETVILEKDGAA